MKILQAGNRFNFADITGTPPKLPVGIYLLKLDPRSGEYYLVKKDDFILPKKIYGTHKSEIDRWLHSYEQNSEKNMGIILTGIKGTGKTITCQMLCQRANKPVILINDTFTGNEFIDFITSPALHDCIVFVDEFEKIYSGYSTDANKSPTDFLSIMDGNYNTRLLFLLTVNNMSLSDFLINRPGRIKYRKHYDNLPDETVEAVIDDLLVNKDHKESIYKFFEAIGIVTFDLLVCLIKDMNLFNEDALTCGKHLNIKAEPSKYEVMEEKDGKLRSCCDVSFSSVTETLIIDRIEYFQGTRENDWEDAEDSREIVRVKDCKVIKKENAITIVTPTQHRFRLTRKPTYSYIF
jgi:hypothetical protein